MADIHENRPTKRGFSSSGDDACRRLVTRADTHANQEEDLQEMAPVKKMIHVSIYIFCPFVSTSDFILLIIYFFNLSSSSSHLYSLHIVVYVGY
jgi:hypothetical protein